VQIRPRVPHSPRIQVCLENTSLRRARCRFVTDAETNVNRNVTTISRVIAGLDPAIHGASTENPRKAGVLAVRFRDPAAVPYSGYGRDSSCGTCVAPKIRGAQPYAHETASERPTPTPQTEPLGARPFGPKNWKNTRCRSWCSSGFGQSLFAFAALAKTLKLALLIDTVASCFIQIGKADTIGVNEGIKDQRVAG
jgi:hypothetical protein